MKSIILVNILLLITSVLTDDVRLTDLDPPEAQQVIESKDTSLKYAPKVESNVPAVRVLGDEPTHVVEDIYLANQYHGQDGLGGYLYGYSVPDIAKTEKKKAGGDLRGAYNYISGDGQEIKVEYWDDGNGFHQVDNVPKILPKQIDDSPEVKAAKEEHARIWAEEAERNSKPIENPYPNAEPGAYAGLGAGVGAGIATAGLRHGGQGAYNTGGQGGYSRSGGNDEQAYSASGKQGFSVTPGGYQGQSGGQGGYGGNAQNNYGGQKPQGGFGGSGQNAYGGSQSGARPSGVGGSGQSAYGGSHSGGTGQSAYGGSQSGSGQNAFGGSQGKTGQGAYGGSGQSAYGGAGQSAYGGSHTGSGQNTFGGSQGKPGQSAYGGSGQSAFGGGQSGSGQNAFGGSQGKTGQGAYGGSGQSAYGSAPSGSGQNAYGGSSHSGSPQSAYGGGSQASGHGGAQGFGQSGASGQGYSGASTSYNRQQHGQPIQGSSNQNNLDYSGQYSENQQTYARNPQEDSGDWKDEEHEEEKGPPKGFFYNFDYPVGIIVSKQGQHKRESLNNLYNTNKAAFEQQLKGGAAVHGSGSYPNYQVHS